MIDRLRLLWQGKSVMVGVTAIAMLICSLQTAFGQLPDTNRGDLVPRDVREMYDRGLQYLAKTQAESGDWSRGSESGGGTTGLALLAFLASGEDPNFGIYRSVVRKAVKNIIRSQSAETGYIGPSMYHHGFAMLALAEAYGAVDERDLWDKGDDGKKRSIGAALELAVRCAVTSQKKNPYGAWRYSPDARDADTSVAGAVLMGLLAARNAGIEVPDESIDKSISYFVSMTSTGGTVAYAGGLGGFGDSLARSCIATLVFSISKRKDLKQFKSALGYITDQLEATASSWPDYCRYYQAQALFQGDVEAWKKWNTLTIRTLKSNQREDGSFEGQLGQTTSTSMALLALALNYRFLPIYER